MKFSDGQVSKQCRPKSECSWKSNKAPFRIGKMRSRNANRWVHARWRFHRIRELCAEGRSYVPKAEEGERKGGGGFPPLFSGVRGIFLEKI